MVLPQLRSLVRRLFLSFHGVVQVTPTVVIQFYDSVPIIFLICIIFLLTMILFKLKERGFLMVRRLYILQFTSSFLCQSK